MLNNEEEKQICKKYIRTDDAGLTHCWQCPLILDNYGKLCKNNCHYDEQQQEWVYDE